MDAIKVQAPSSRSVSHRMLIGAALAEGESVVEGVSESPDWQGVRAVLEAAGARLEPMERPGAYRVTGVAGRPEGAPLGQEAVSCDVRESGFACRLLTAVLAAGQGLFRLHGAPRMNRRPMGALTDALEAQGARFRFEEERDCLPLVLEATGLEGGEVTIGLEESSLYLSGLLLAGPMAASALTLYVGGEHVVAWSPVGLTLQTLRDFGILFDVSVRDSDAVGRADGGWKLADWRNLHAVRPGLVRFRVRPSTYRAGRYTVEGDWSGASYLLAAGVLGTRPVAVAGLRPDSLQGDRVIRDILQGMGADVRLVQSPESGGEKASDGEEALVMASPSTLHGVDIDMEACPALVPVVAVLAAAAEGDTRIRGAARLRVGEDRMAALAKELVRAGVEAEAGEDGMVIHGRGRPDLGGRTLELAARGDPRMAMSLSLLECLGAQVRLDCPEGAETFFPSFWKQWREVRPCRAR